MLAKLDSRVGFSLGMNGKLDKLVGTHLSLGEIFEICGIRHTAKYHVAHSLLANILNSYRDEADSCRVFVFDYGHKFNPALLKRFIQEASLTTDEEIECLFNMIDVANIAFWEELHLMLRRIMETVNEDRIWKCVGNGMEVTKTIIFITDIGSLLHDTSYLGIAGRLVQDQIFRCLDGLAKAGAFVFMVNYCVDKHPQFPLIPTLGANWRKCVTHRLFISRDLNDEKTHIALANDENERTHFVKFRI